MPLKIRRLLSLFLSFNEDCRRFHHAQGLQLRCSCKLFACKLISLINLASAFRREASPRREGSMLSPVKPVHAQVAGNIDEGQRLGGWRREQTTPSLAEVFGSIRTRPTGSMWRKLLAF